MNERQEEILKPFPKVIEFIESLKDFPFGKQDGKPLPEWKFFEAETLDAVWNAPCDAARDAAWNAACDAARNAAWNAACDAARDAAWNAACDAARDAVWNAAWNAAWDAAWDAALFVRYILVDDLDFPNKEKHKEYVRKLWEVYQKGYYCSCDIDGVLYVYGVKK